MDRLTSSTLIQVNATVIAGLLILLTITSISNNTIISQYLVVSDDVAMKKAEQEGLIDQKMYLENTLNSIDDQFRKEHLQQELDNIELKYRQAAAELRGLENKKAELEKFSASHGLFKFPAELKIVIFAMITPFALSAMVEIISAVSKRHQNTEKATKLGIGLTIFGFAMIFLGVNYIFEKTI